MCAGPGRLRQHVFPAPTRSDSNTSSPLDWVNFLEQTIFGISSFVSAMAIVAHAVDSQTDYTVNVILVVGITLIAGVALYLLPKARMVSVNDSGVAGNLLYAVERRAKVLTRQASNDEEIKRIRNLQRGFLSGFARFIAKMTTFGDLFDSPVGRRRKKIRDEMVVAQEQFFKNSLVELEFRRSTLRTQVDVSKELVKLWHERYKVVFQPRTAWESVRRTFLLMFEWDVQQCASLAASPGPDGKAARQYSRTTAAARKKEEAERGRLAKHIKDVGDHEEKFSVGQEAYVLCSSRNNALVESLRLAVEALPREDDLLVRQLEADKEAKRAKAAAGRA